MPARRRAASLHWAMSCDLYPLDAPGQGGIAEQRRPPGAHARSACGCSLRRQQAPPAAIARIDMGVPALRGHLISLVAHDHLGPPGHHRGRVTQPDRTFLGIPRHLGEPQLPGADRAEQFFPACDLAAQHVDDEEVVGQYRAEQIMIGGEQGGEERLIAREDLAGVDVVCRLHGSSPDDQPGFAYLRLAPVAAGGLTPCRRKGESGGPAPPDSGQPDGLPSPDMQRPAGCPD